MRKGNMKKLLTQTLLASAIATAMVASPAQAGSITVVSWGGAYTKSQIEAYHKPWSSMTGHSIKSEDYSGGLAAVKAMVEAGNVTWDLVDVELSDAIRGCDDGILEVIDASVLPDGNDGSSYADDFLPGTITECAVANIIWSTIFAYDTSKTQGVEGIADFFDLDKFPGKRGMRKGPKPNLEIALMADGVPASEIYDMLSTPEGIDRAFAKLDSIKDSVVWWEAGAQPPQLLADGEVVMTTAYNGRIFNAIAAEGKPFAINWDSQIWDLDLWVIPKGTPNKELAMDFVKYSTGTKALAAQASWIPYAPARKSSAALISTYHNQPELDMGPHMPTTPENFKNALQNNFEFWADNQDQLNERFNAWMSK
jgi:putative spermidine/putrescine transport system substrate-binding protein